MAPSTVRKKNEYSPRPLNVRSVRKSPRRIYKVEMHDDRMRALIGASEALDVEAGDWLGDKVRKPTTPSWEKMLGNQPVWAAATTMRPATKEFPSKEPATTKQMKITAMMPSAGPPTLLRPSCSCISGGKSALWWYQTHNSDAVSHGDEIPRKQNIVGHIRSDKAQNDSRDGSVDSERQLACRSR